MILSEREEGGGGKGGKPRPPRESHSRFRPQLQPKLTSSKIPGGIGIKGSLINDKHNEIRQKLSSPRGDELTRI